VFASVASDLARIFMWYAGVVCVVAVAENRWPAGALAGYRHRVFNFGIAIVNAVLLVAFSILIEWLPDTLRVNGLLGIVFDGWQPVGTGSLILATLVYAFVWDFWQYWCHRLQHSSRILWPVHILHHDDDVDTTTALRRSFAEQIVNYFLSGVPTFIVCGFHLLPIYGSILLFQTWGFFNHANIRLDLGPLTAVVSGPQWHRLHHGRANGRRSFNFAAFFPLIDVVFGTYRQPGASEYPPTGLENHPTAVGGPPALLHAVLVAPLRQILQGILKRTLLRRPIPPPADVWAASKRVALPPRSAVAGSRDEQRDCQQRA
jgi:sterol desaturase/sphingolipid hydroxylase (fatty acid hydroxylase superfamily)